MTPMTGSRLTATPREMQALGKEWTKFVVPKAEMLVYIFLREIFNHHEEKGEMGV